MPQMTENIRTTLLLQSLNRRIPKKMILDSEVNPVSRHQSNPGPQKINSGKLIQIEEYNRSNTEPQKLRCGITIKSLVEEHELSDSSDKFKNTPTPPLRKRSNTLGRFDPNDIHNKNALLSGLSTPNGLIKTPTLLLNSPLRLLESDKPLYRNKTLQSKGGRRVSLSHVCDTDEDQDSSNDSSISCSKVSSISFASSISDKVSKASRRKHSVKLSSYDSKESGKSKKFKCVN